MTRFFNGIAAAFTWMIDRIAHSMASAQPTLEELLQHPQSRRQFEAFVQKEHSPENLAFYDACNGFDSLSSEKERKEAFMNIKERFVRRNADEWVNLSGPNTAAWGTPKAVMSDLDMRNAVNQSRTEIFNLMSTDSYSRFLALSPKQRADLLAPKTTPGSHGAQRAQASAADW